LTSLGLPHDNNRTDLDYLEVQNVAITNVTTNTDNVTAGELVYINVTVMNKGTVNVSVLPVSAYYNGNLISDLWCNHTRWIFDRLPGNVTTLIFTWDTTGVASGSYTISANATLLPYETNPDDNTLEAGNPVNVSSTGIHNIAIVNIVPSETVVKQGSSIYIDVTVKNEGAFTELLFYLTACVNTIIIETKNVTNLPSGNETTITFTWNTTGVAKCMNACISAYAHPVPGETDTDDNTYTDGWFLVIGVGDVNGDMTVNVLDLILVLINVGPVPPKPPECDINCDDKVNVLDIILCLVNAGPV